MDRLLNRCAVLRRDLLAALALGLTALVVTGLHVHEHKSLSVFDEYVYVDYYVRLVDHGPAREGGMVGDFTRRELGCRGVRFIVKPDSRLCRHVRAVPDDQLPIQGHTSADIYTPLYFASARLLAEPLVLLGVNLVQAGRLAGGVWLALGAVLLYGALRRMWVPRSVGVALGLLMVGSVPAYWGNSYLSTDATAFAAGGGMLLLATYVTREASRWWVVAYVVASMVATWFKFQNLAAVAVASVALVLMARRDAYGAGRRGGVRRLARDRRAQSAVLAVVAGLVAQIAWMGVRSALAIGVDPSFGIQTSMRARYLLLDAFAFLPGAAGGLNPGWQGGLMSTIVGWVMVGGLFAGLVVSKTRPWSRQLAVAAFISSLTAGPVFSLIVWIQAGGYVPLPARYGMALVPALLACAGLAARRAPSPTRWGLLGLGLLVVGLSLGLTG